MSGIKPSNIRSDARIITVASSVANFLKKSEQTSATEGDPYYDTTLNQLRTYDGSSWSPAGMNSAVAGSWNSVITIGAKVTTDNAAEIELSAAASSLLTLDANGTTNVDILDVSSAAGTGDLINLTQAGTGVDIRGTSDTWSVAKTGNATLNAVGLADGKNLNFGSSSDVSVNWDSSNLLIEALAQDTGEIRIGSTNAINLAVYGNTNTDIFLFDVSTAIAEINGWTLHIQDTDELQFGDASGGDVSFTWDTTNLLIEAFADNTGQIRIGSTNAIDLAVYGSTNTNIALFDVSEAILDMNGWDINLQDDDFLRFGDGDDITIEWDTAGTDALLIEGGAANNQIKFGTTTNVDVLIHGGTSTNVITFDTDDSALECIFDGFDLRFKDDDYILLGDAAAAAGTTDGTIRWDNTNSTIEIIGATQFEDNVQMDGNLTLSGTLTMSGALAPGSVSLGDAESLIFGDGTDYTISTAGSTAALIITAANANDSVNIGDGSVATDFRIDNITNAGSDFWWDQSADTAAGTLYLGTDGKGFDVVFYGETAGDNITFDMSADRMQFEDISLTMMDDTTLLFGDGVTGAGDFSIQSDGSSLLIGEIASAGKDIQIGVDGKGLDVKFFGETASSYALWDQSADALLLESASLALGDGDAILLGDTLGTGDFSISSTAAVMTIGQVASGTGTIAMGADGKGIDQKWFAETAGDFMLWDQNGHSNLGALRFEDSAVEYVGANVTYSYAISTDALLVDATDHANASLVFGSNGTNGLNVTLTSATAGDSIVFDAGANTLTSEDVAFVLNDNTTLGFGDSAAEGTISSDGSNIVVSDTTVFTLGAQNAAVSRTPTVDGAGNGLIADGSKMITVADGGNAAFWLTLPTPTPGNIIFLLTSGDATGFEIRTDTPASVGINGGTGASAESAIAAAITMVRCVCVSATEWICSQWDADGDESKVTAAA